MSNEATQKMETERTTPNIRVVSPRVDIYESADSLFLVADLPGVDDQGIDITLEKRVLTIRGTPKRTVPEGASIVYGESETGLFERAFTITDEVDRDRVSAHVKDGVLRLELPKAKHVIQKKIPVNSVS